MTFFTLIGIAIASLFLYLLLFIIIIFIAGGFDEDNIFMAAITVGVAMSIILATFIVDPQNYGYQKITVSENKLEVKE